MKNKIKKQNGSTLLEVLITMIIGSISVLGFAAMQLRAQQEHRIGFYKTLAVGYSAQILEGQRNNYKYTRDGNSIYTLLPTDATPLPPAGDCEQINCSAAEINIYERYKVVYKIRQNLPESGVQIGWVFDPGIGEDPNNISAISTMVDTAKHPVVKVTIIWKEPEVNATTLDNNCTFATSFASMAGYRCTFMSTTL